MDEEIHDLDAGGSITAQTITRSYEDDDTGGVYDHAFRFDSITYPNGREIRVDYGTSGSAQYDAIGRPSGVTDTTGSYAITAYDRMGSGRIARKSYPVAKVRLDYRDEGSEGTSGSDPYDASWDTLGRTVRCQWETYDGSGDAVAELFHVTHAYDGSSNRVYDHRKVYTLHSTAYTHDEMDRVDGVGTGLLDTDGNDDVVLDGNGLATLDDHWVLDDREWTLDQLNNPEQVDTAFDASDKYGVDTNDANEIETKHTDPTDTPDGCRRRS